MTTSVTRCIYLQHARLVEVTSNIWGTKFKFHGLADSVPANLGQVTYRTSLLHLQPRQMTLVMTELRDDVPAGTYIYCTCTMYIISAITNKVKCVDHET